LTVKNDNTFYRFQTPYFWPSNCFEPENTDYAVYLCKRTMQNKTRLELADYEAENLAKLQKMFSRKWEFIFMQAEGIDINCVFNEPCVETLRSRFSFQHKVKLIRNVIS
jgi:hypothetical protein